MPCDCKVNWDNKPQALEILVGGADEGCGCKECKQAAAVANASLPKVEIKAQEDIEDETYDGLW